MKKTSDDQSEYLYDDAELNHSHEYILPALLANLNRLHAGQKSKRVFELGCGNGSVANELAKTGYIVTGVDPSEQGIAQAHQRYPALNLVQGSAYDNLVNQFGQFPTVISLEVVEHVYSPKKYASTLFDLVEPGGYAIISTPYHGYFKNLALAVSGRMDKHFTALWECGHIKFWSFNTLRVLLEDVGFENVVFQRVGRVPVIAKSMIAVAKKKA